MKILNAIIIQTKNNLQQVISLPICTKQNTDNFLNVVMRVNNWLQTKLVSFDSSFVNDMYFDLTSDLSDLSSAFSGLSYTNKPPDDITLTQKMNN